MTAAMSDRYVDTYLGPGAATGVPAEREVGSPLWWLNRLERKLKQRRGQISVYDDYYEGNQPLAFAGEKFLRAFGGLFESFADNWTDLVVDAVEERLDVEGFRLDAAVEKGDDDAWRMWQANNLDRDSQIGHTEALIHGEAFVLAWAGADDKTPSITIEHPSQMIVESGARRDRRAALKMWTDMDGLDMATVYLPDNIYKFRQRTKAETQARFSTLSGKWVARETPGEAWPLRNPLKVVPVIPLENRPRLLRPSVSEIKRVIPLQNAVNKLVADMLVASEYAAFKQRWVTGMEIPVDPDTGQEIEPFRAAVDRLFMSEDEKTKFGEFSETQLSNFVAAIELLVQHIASQTRTPPHYFYLSGSFPSGEPVWVDEPLLTANRGWTTMGDVVAGDKVFAPSGEAVEVLQTAPIHTGRPCFRVTFDDHSSVVADAGHFWSTLSLPGMQTSAKREPMKLTTRQIADTLRMPNVGNGRGRNGLGTARHAIPVAEPLDAPEAGLPLDPWLLGYWLGNGSASGGQLTCHVGDSEWLTARIHNAGHAASVVAHEEKQSARINVRALRTPLRSMRLLGDKRIPAEYFAASFKQRLALLQGVLDADGSADFAGRATIDLNDEQLATDVASLVMSLGQKVRLRSERAHSITPDGRRYDYTRWRLAWTPSIEAFAMPRKLERLRTVDEGKARLRYIVAVEAVESVPVRCITVDSPEHLFLIGRSLIPTHNSIKSAETGLVRKAYRKQRSFGETWEEVIRLGFAVVGDARSKAFGAETIWGDPESRTESEHVDATIKLLALDVPKRALWERANFSQTQIERFAKMRKEEEADKALNAQEPDPTIAIRA